MERRILITILFFGVIFLFSCGVKNYTAPPFTEVDKILQLSMIESRSMSFEKEPLDLHKMLDEVVQRLKLIIEQKGANIELDLQLKDTLIQGDYTHLSSAFNNLVENKLLASLMIFKL